MIVVFIDQLSVVGMLARAARPAQQQTHTSPMPKMIERSFILTPLNEMVRPTQAAVGEPRNGH